MPKGKTDSAEAAASTAPLDEVPAWQRRSIERSLTAARQRAHARSDRFVTAALELLGGAHGGDFTVQDVVDRSDMSIRTFYSYFDGKDSLLLAAYETLMSKQVVPMLRERSAKQTDPVGRLHAAIDGLFEITLRDRQVARGLSGFYYRLAETRPRDLTHALEPLHGLITELLSDIADHGALRTDLTLTAVVSLLQDMLLTSAHSAVFAETRTTTTDELWAFCSAAILAPTARATRPSKR
ncbi:MAG TPA: TetR/AcrR family transcriptional regulator [Mycobacteriales bacterium]|nr:TetR/AcrR family transcriptional regulator [Mycobacteriales bacterium]